MHFIGFYNYSLLALFLTDLFFYYVFHLTMSLVFTALLYHEHIFVTIKTYLFSILVGG